MTEHRGEPILFGARLPYPASGAEPDEFVPEISSNVDAGTATLRRRIQHVERVSALRQIGRWMVRLLAPGHGSRPGIASHSST